jgi:hypothetical protein
MGLCQDYNIANDVTYYFGYYVVKYLLVFKNIYIN